MSTQNIGSMFGWTSYIVRIGAPCLPCAEAQCTGTGTQSGPRRSRHWHHWHDMGMMTPWEKLFFWDPIFSASVLGLFFRISVSGSQFFLAFFLNESLIHFWRGGFEWTKFSKTEAGLKVFGGWKWAILVRVKFSNVPTKKEKMGKFPFPFTFSAVNGQSSEWDVFFAPRTSTATNKHPTNIHFGAKKPGCRGVEALPKDLDEVGHFFTWVEGWLADFSC